MCIFGHRLIVLSMSHWGGLKAQPPGLGYNRPAFCSYISRKMRSRIPIVPLPALALGLLREPVEGVGGSMNGFDVIDGTGCGKFAKFDAQLSLGRSDMALYHRGGQDTDDLSVGFTARDA